MSDRGLSERYDRWRKSELGRITDALEHRLFEEMIGPIEGRRLFDVGCGDGAMARSFAKAGAHVTAIDADPAMLVIATASAQGLARPPSFILAEAEALPFADDSFDIVMASALLCLVRDPRPVVREMARVLKPEGRLVVGDLGAWSIWNGLRRVRGIRGDTTWRNAHFFSRQDLFAFLRQAGLEPEAARGAIFYPPSGCAAALMARGDLWLGRLTTLGASLYHGDRKKAGAKS